MRFWTLRLNVPKPASEWSRPGKAEWPDMVRLGMGKRDAVRVLRAIADQLERDDESLYINLAGELLLMDDDDEPIATTEESGTGEDAK